MDRIILGDNQFFGINHMSEEKAQAQAEKFRDAESILKVVDGAYDCGIHGFMFNTHEQVGGLCEHFRNNPRRYSDLRLYPSLPYAHKYANAVNERGLVGALNEFVVAANGIRQAFRTVLRGGKSIVNNDLIDIMKILVDFEMHVFRGLNVQAVFLQNIVTDLLLGMRAGDVFVAFAEHIRTAYAVEPAFNTMNMPELVSFLLDCGLEKPIVCSSINRHGYLMSPSVRAYEETLARKSFQAIAMSILASGAVPVEEAIDYVCRLPNVRSIVFGASSRAHIEQTRHMILEEWGKCRLKSAV